jgi:thioredoxin 2
VDATTATFDDATTANVPVVVDLWAPWCGPCRMVAPILEDLAADRAGRIKVVKVNVDDEPQVSARFGVQGIPTMLLFDDGELVGRQTGALPAVALTRWVDDTARSRP